MSADDIELEDFSKEEQRRVELNLRIRALQIAMPIVKEFYLLAIDANQRMIDEMKSLEEARDALSQGQLILD